MGCINQSWTLRYRCLPMHSMGIKTIKKAAKIGYAALTHFARQSYGPLLNVILEQEDSPEKVIELLMREGKTARLELPIPPELKGPILTEDDQ
jgi:hypothetical protein